MNKCNLCGYSQIWSHTYRLYVLYMRTYVITHFLFCQSVCYGINACGILCVIGFYRTCNICTHVYVCTYVITYYDYYDFINRLKQMIKINNH